MALQFQTFEQQAPEIANAFERLLNANEVAFLATVSSNHKPRLHPFVPRVVAGQLLAFIMDDSPKIRDLHGNGHYALHTLPGQEDEECYLSGRAVRADQALFEPAAQAMGFATGVDEHHILFEFQLERGLWTRWLDFGTPDHRPLRQGWNEQRGQFSR
jgi:hypothetical protein